MSRSLLLTLLAIVLLCGCAGPAVQPTPAPTSAARGPAPYEILDIGEDTTWDDRPMAYLQSQLAGLDPAGAAQEAQVRWGYGLLYEQYPGVEVLELTLDWEDELSLILSTTAADWEALASGRRSWTRFWDEQEKEALDLASGDLYTGSEVDDFLLERAGPVAQAPTRRPALPTARPTAAPTARSTARPPAATTVPAVPLGRTYKDAAGFFELDYPRGWSTHPSRSEMQFWADAEGNSALAVSIQVKALSAAALADEWSAFFGERWDGYRELSRRETTLDGSPAVWIEQSYRQDGAAQRGLLVAVVRNRVGLLLLAWAPEAGYAALGDSFAASISSLRWSEYAEAPPYDEWASYKSAHITFHYLPGTWVERQIRTIAADHEETFSDIVATLGIRYNGTIDFFLYTSEESFYRSTARDAGFAINAGREVHTRWFAPDDHQSLGHEMTHILTYWALGDPSEALLGEGIAVCLDHSGKDHQAIARELLDAGEVIALAEMLGDAWGEYEYAYQVSGAFVCFLVDEYGVAQFKEVYPQADMAAAMAEVYGADLEALEESWLETLR